MEEVQQTNPEENLEKVDLHEKLNELNNQVSLLNDKLTTTTKAYQKALEINQTLTNRLINSEVKPSQEEVKKTLTDSTLEYFKNK